MEERGQVGAQSGMVSRNPSSSDELGDALAALDAGLGSARKLHILTSSSGLSVAAGRWRHVGASLALNAITPARLVFSLNGGQRLHWHRRGKLTTTTAHCGSVAVVGHDAHARIDVEGRGDTFQIVVARIACSDPTLSAIPVLPTQRRAARLRTLSAQAIVASKAGDVRRLEALLEVIAPIVAAPVLRPAVRFRGGITPSVLARLKDNVEIQLRIDPERLPSVRELADQAGLSLWHFIRAFKASEGITPHVWMSDRRRELALSLLLEAGSSVADAAFASGYGSAPHFVATFRRAMGVTPGQLQDAVLAD